MFKQAAQQSSRFRQCIFHRFRPEPEPSKIQVLAGTNRPELSSGAPLDNFKYILNFHKISQLF